MTATTLGLGTYGVAWAIGVPGYPQPVRPMDAFAFVDRAASLGLHVAQIADNLPIEALSADNRRALFDHARNADVRIEIGTRGIAPDHLRRMIAIAAECESPILRVVVDTKTHHPTPDEVIGIARDVLPDLESAGVTLTIENHDRFPVAALARIIDSIGSPKVGICLDTVNSFGSLEGPAVVVSALAPYTVNLHVKEFTIARLSHNMGFTITGAPTGQGMLDLPWLLAELDRHGRSYSAIIETWLSPETNPAHTDAENMAATIAKEADWVVQSVRYLRGLIHA